MSHNETVYYIEKEGVKRRVDSYYDFRNGAFEELRRFGHIASPKVTKLYQILRLTWLLVSPILGYNALLQITYYRLHCHILSP